MTRLSATPIAVLALGLSALSAGVVTLAPAALDADSLLAKGVASAFGTRPVSSETAATVPFDPSGLRLSAWGDAEGLVSGLVHIGDRITITGADGRPRAFEVVESRALDTASLAGSEAREARLMLVTTRAVGEPARILRFVVESPVETRSVAPEPHRAL